MKKEIIACALLLTLAAGCVCNIRYLNRLCTQLDDAAAEIEEGRAQILEARHDLNDLGSPEWYLLDRSNNPGYSEFTDDAQRVDRIAAVFPVFFILVAALVCLTTMTRMVEEHRTQMGTLKALGYGKGAIIAKYLVYALSASFFLFHSIPFAYYLIKTDLFDQPSLACSLISHLQPLILHNQ